MSEEVTLKMNFKCDIETENKRIYKKDEFIVAMDDYVNRDYSFVSSTVDQTIPAIRLTDVIGMINSYKIEDDGSIFVSFNKMKEFDHNKFDLTTYLLGDIRKDKSIDIKKIIYLFLTEKE